MAHHVLVVCTGNICRSPMAELLLRQHAALRGLPVEVRSASVLGLDGRPAHPNSVAVMRELGMDLSAHRSQPVTAALMIWADYVLGMELQHSATLRQRYPDADDKILQLGTFGGMMELADPLGGWKGRFRRSRDDIRRCSEAFIDRLPAQKA